MDAYKWCADNYTFKSKPITAEQLRKAWDNAKLRGSLDKMYKNKYN